MHSKRDDEAVVCRGVTRNVFKGYCEGKLRAFIRGSGWAGATIIFLNIFLTIKVDF